MKKEIIKMYTRRSVESSSVNDSFSGTLREAVEYFKGMRLQMVGRGFEEIVTDSNLFNVYISKLSEDLDPTDSEVFKQLCENSRMAILGESSISNLEPIAGLSMPTVRKMWPRIALRYAIPNEAAKTPKFLISYMSPYMVDSTGKRYELPKALRENPGSDLTKKAPLDKTPLVFVNNAIENVNLITLAGGSVAVGDSIDTIFAISEVTVNCLDEDGLNPEPVAVTVNFRLDINNKIFGHVTAAHSDGTVTEDTLFASVDLINGDFIATSVKGNLLDLTVEGSLSSENNTRSKSISFEIKRKDVTIGTGTHLNAPLPIEFLQDTMAMFNIDAAVEIVDLMSNVTSLDVEHEIIGYLKNSFTVAGSPYQMTFDCRPSSGFAGSPKDWRYNIRQQIDYFATKMKNDTSFSVGKFTIIGNPVDTLIIDNIDWVFNHTTEENSGVTVEYNIGTYSSAHRYEVISTPEWTAGTMMMIFIPGTPRQMTYKYYPYTFNVEKGYRDPNQPNVPSIMMTKRHTIEELIPLACQITIRNNDGTLPSTAGY
jgi:hypothetical protein